MFKRLKFSTFIDFPVGDFPVAKILQKRNLIAVLIATTAVLLSMPPVVAAEGAEPIKRLQFEPRIFGSISKENAKGVVITVHGTTQHSGSFETLAKHLVANGFIVVSVDLRGHGARYHLPKPGSNTAIERRVDYSRSAEDLIAIFKQARRKYHGLPLFCIGESVGAGVATRAAGSSPGLLDGMILCSAGTRPCVFNPFMVANDFVKGIWRLDHLMDVSRYIDRYSADDKRVSNEMISDPLSRIRLTPREILQTAFFIRRTPESAKKIDPSLPVLIVQGELDHIVGSHQVNAILKNLPSLDKKIVLLPKCGHVLLGTSYLKPVVLDSVTDWLTEEALKKSAPIALRNENALPNKTTHALLESHFAAPLCPLLSSAKQKSADKENPDHISNQFAIPLCPTIDDHSKLSGQRSASHAPLESNSTAAM